MPQDIHPKADVEKEEHTSSKGEFGPWSLGMTSIALVTNLHCRILRRSGEHLILSEFLTGCRQTSERHILLPECAPLLSLQSFDKYTNKLLKIKMLHPEQFAFQWWFLNPGNLH